jgi:hypothetical protein
MFRIVFWDVLPCKIIVDRRFRGAYCIHHHGVISQKTAIFLVHILQTSSLMMEAVGTSETSVDNYFTQQYIPEDNSEHHTRRRENLKSHMYERLSMFSLQDTTASKFYSRYCQGRCGGDSVNKNLGGRYTIISPARNLIIHNAELLGHNPQRPHVSSLCTISWTVISAHTVISVSGSGFKTRPIIANYWGTSVKKIVQQFPCPWTFFSFPSSASTSASTSFLDGHC